MTQENFSNRGIERNSPEYFRHCWNRHMFHIDDMRERQKLMRTEVAEIEDMLDDIPLPETQTDYDNRLHQLKILANRQANMTGLSQESFWADFDPETGLDIKE